jgi:hypothetical protein
MSRTVISLSRFVTKIASVKPAVGEVLLYRGHPKRSYKLLPTVLRDPKHASAEHAMLRELVSSHPAEFASDATTLEQLARAQHYSLPTRLLDVTWNPLVALYFAVKEHEGSPGEVIVFRVQNDHVKFYDSDTVSCVANLAHLKAYERDTINWKLTSKDDFNKQEPIQRLLHFVRAEKSHFRDEVVAGHLKTVLCVKPKLSSQRILVQAGAFLLFGISGELDVNGAPGITTERVIVNGKHKVEFLQQLDSMNINESTLFPEVEKAAQYIKGKASG